MHQKRLTCLYENLFFFDFADRIRHCPLMSNSSAAAVEAGAWLCSASPAVAVLFFGALRSAWLPRRTLTDNVVGPLERSFGGGVDVFVHAMLTPELNNMRSGELNLSVDLSSFSALGPACRYASDDQDEVDRTVLASYNNSPHAKWELSTFNAADKANAYRAWYSLQRAAQLARAHEAKFGITYRYVAAVRSDTAVYSPLRLPPEALAIFLGGGSNIENTILLPHYQHWHGLNDRFAFGQRRILLDVYAEQLTFAKKKHLLRVKNTEAFLCQVLQHARAHVLLAAIWVVRVRADGLCTTSALNLPVETRVPSCGKSATLVALTRSSIDSPYPRGMRNLLPLSAREATAQIPPRVQCPHPASRNGSTLAAAKHNKMSREKVVSQKPCSTSSPDPGVQGPRGSCTGSRSR